MTEALKPITIMVRGYVVYFEQARESQSSLVGHDLVN